MARLDTLLAQTPINNLSPAGCTAVEAVVRAHLGETFPALALTVINRGDVLLNAAWGWIDPDAQTLPVQPDTLFDLASVSKLFTTTAFLSLVSAGRVALHDPLVSVIPEFGITGPRPLDGGQDPHSKAPLPTPESVRGQTADPLQVSFYHLLTHTSGLAPWRDVFKAAGPPPAPPEQTDAVPRAERWSRALHALCQYPFVGQPGDGIVRYSDLGLLLVGEATSRLHGTPGALDAAITARVCAPLGLTSVTFNPLHHDYAQSMTAPTEDDPGWRGRRCWGEVHDENACGVGGVAGHAGLFSTARDVAALGQAWLAHDPRLSITLDVQQPAVSEREFTGDTRRGLGWMIKAPQNASAGDRFSPQSFGHTGFTGTSLWIDPERRLVVACLTNSVYPGRGKPGTHEFRRAIHDTLAVEADGSA